MQNFNCSITHKANLYLNSLQSLDPNLHTAGASELRLCGLMNGVR